MASAKMTAAREDRRIPRESESFKEASPSPAYGGCLKVWWEAVPAEDGEGADNEEAEVGAATEEEDENGFSTPAFSSPCPPFFSTSPSSPSAGFKLFCFSFSSSAFLAVAAAAVATACLSARWALWRICCAASLSTSTMCACMKARLTVRMLNALRPTSTSGKRGFSRHKRLGARAAPPIHAYWRSLLRKYEPPSRTLTPTAS
mmetsp:Transcript_35733/g.60448  ORF Transcript_35733/g.60448 Transcript_35733/m.60448 type:complete len:203 (-) Transcript_35733:159-767(-)